MCLGTTLCKDGTCSAEVCIRIASTMAAMARLNWIWWCNTISLTSKFKRYKSRITSILLYGCETWTLLGGCEKGIQAFKTKRMRKLLCISYLEHKTNHWVWSKSNFPVSQREPLLATIKRWKLSCFWYVTRLDSLSKNHPSGHFGGWLMLWSAEKMLDGQLERVDISAHARTAHTGLLQKRLEEDLCLTILNWTEMKCGSLCTA